MSKLVIQFGDPPSMDMDAESCYNKYLEVIRQEDDARPGWKFLPEIERKAWIAACSCEMEEEEPMEEEDEKESKD